jgi:hypothetical protein
MKLGLLEYFANINKPRDFSVNNGEMEKQAALGQVAKAMGQRFDPESPTQQAFADAIADRSGIKKSFPVRISQRITNNKYGTGTVTKIPVSFANFRIK